MPITIPPHETVVEVPLSLIMGPGSPRPHSANPCGGSATDPPGTALLSTVDGADLVTTGAAHQQVVAGWAEDWRRAGRPGLDDLQPYLVRTSTGWLVRAHE
ncbi:MAG: hypothetical protein ABR608_04225 [Pseudonocardiaceae bacterium]